MQNIFTEIITNSEQMFFWGNSFKQWIMAIILFLGAILFFKIVFWVIFRQLRKMVQKTVNDIDDFVLVLIEGIKPPFYYIVSFYIATKVLTFGETFSQLVFAVFIIVTVLQAVFVLLKIVDFVIERESKKASREDQNSRRTILQFLGQIIKGAVWVMGILMVLGNLGVNVNSLIAGLGIGGLAIAMALKNILADIFSSFSILIDKPFVVGDFIGISDKQQGTVKRIGIKTTRLETRDGQELIIANKKLTDQVVQNFRGSSGSKKERGTSFTIGVTYETPHTKLKLIPKIIKEIIIKEEHTKLKRVVFDNFGDFSLNFKIFLVIKETKQLSVAEIKSKINYEIVKAFTKEGIDFAYPTQTVYLANSQTENTLSK